MYVLYRVYTATCSIEQYHLVYEFQAGRGIDRNGWQTLRSADSGSLPSAILSESSEDKYVLRRGGSMHVGRQISMEHPDCPSLYIHFPPSALREATDAWQRFLFGNIRLNCSPC